MGFGGSVSAMINSLKSNARPRKKAFEQTKKYIKDYPPTRAEIKDPPLSPKRRIEIRKKMEMEFHQTEKKKVYVFIVTIAIMIILLYLGIQLFNYKLELLP